MKLNLIRKGSRNIELKGVDHHAFSADSRRCIVRQGGTERKFEGIDSVHGFTEDHK